MAITRTSALWNSIRRFPSYNSSLLSIQFYKCHATFAAQTTHKKRRPGLKGKKDHPAYQHVVDFVKEGRIEGIERLKQNVVQSGTPWNQHTFDSQFLAVCSDIGAFSLGKQFFTKLLNNGSAGVGAIGKFFSLCYKCRRECQPADLELITTIYKDLLKRHEILDVSTCEAVAQGIGLTEHWRVEIPRLLEMVNFSGSNSSVPLLSTAVEVALLHGDESLAWMYMNSIADLGKSISPRLVDSILDHRPQQLHRFMRWLEENGIILSMDCAEVMVQKAASLEISVQIGQVPRNGKCTCCSQRLKPTPLSNDDFAQLSSAFLNPVLIGKDIFLKTHPDELKGYLAFLDTILPVDVVLDGLNISFINQKWFGKRSTVLRNVVSHLASQSRKVLVIGRRHMNNWAAADMNVMKNRASVFLADDSSQDDPFILYATLKSGLGTKFVSRDQMSGHRHLLGSPKMQRVFSKWQALHQFHPSYVAADGNVVLRPPLWFCREPQQTSLRVWHLPCVDHSQTSVKGHLQDEQSPWLCVCSLF